MKGRKEFSCDSVAAVHFKSVEFSIFIFRIQNDKNGEKIKTAEQSFLIFSRRLSYFSLMGNNPLLKSECVTRFRASPLDSGERNGRLFF